ncbi:MAG: response regulator transcription factor [Pseudomonadota bacterium]
MPHNRQVAASPPEPSTGNDAHVLIVDDDAQLRQLVSKMLRAHGYRTTAVACGREMLETMGLAPVDLIVLDVMLPGASGLDLCRHVRETSSVPILMLTARSEEVDRVIGLEMGADDYLTKPFGSRELLARIRALLRRARSNPNLVKPPAGTKYAFEGWVVDTLRRELVNPEGAVVDLSTGEYDLLLAFVEAPQRVLTRDQLLDMARNRTVVPGFDRSIDVQISRLRRKMAGDDADGFIKTVRGVGYMFVPAVSRV